MRNPFDPVDQATLGLEWSDVVQLMFPSRSSFCRSDTDDQRRVEVISPSDLVEGFSYEERMADARRLAENAAKRALVGSFIE